MRTKFKHNVAALVLTAFFIGGAVLPAVATPLFQDQKQDRDYSKNKRYEQGMREGQADRAKNKDHSKKRHFSKDEDQEAYEAGYQKGRGN